MTLGATFARGLANRVGAFVRGDAKCPSGKSRGVVEFFQTARDGQPCFLSGILGAAGSVQQAHGVPQQPRLPDGEQMGESALLTRLGADHQVFV